MGEQKPEETAKGKIGCIHVGRILYISHPLLLMWIKLSLSSVTNHTRIEGIIS